MIDKNILGILIKKIDKEWTNPNTGRTIEVTDIKNEEYKMAVQEYYENVNVAKQI